MAELPLEPDHELLYITCALCGMSRKLYKTGRYAKKRERASSAHSKRQSGADEKRRKEELYARIIR